MIDSGDDAIERIILGRVIGYYADRVSGLFTLGHHLIERESAIPRWPRILRSQRVSTRYQDDHFWSEGTPVLTFTLDQCVDRGAAGAGIHSVYPC